MADFCWMPVSQRVFCAVVIGQEDSTEVSGYMTQPGSIKRFGIREEAEKKEEEERQREK